MKLILINGAPRTGKDHAARHLIDFYSDRTIVFERFSRPVKEAFTALMMAGIDEFFQVDSYEKDKEKPIPLLNNTSFRQWQIDFSEKFMKPLYGNTIFGRLMLQRLSDYQLIYPVADYGELLVVIPDCGFQIEVDTVVNDFPPEDILLIRLDRPGFTFANDSRERVEPREMRNGRGLVCEDITNDSTIDVFEQRIRIAVENFLKGPPDAS